MPSDPLPEPWHSFLLDLDKQLAGPTELHCFGGFVVAQCYGLTRPTADIDILDSKGTDLITIAKLAGRTSPLHKRHGVYIDVVAVAVADVPDHYGERLATALDESFEKLQVRIFERHDLVLAKIVRNNDRDRADVAAIAGGPGLDIDVLRARYVEELRPKLGRPEREDLTIELWIENHRGNEAWPTALKSLKSQEP
jgi:hypothetical protein